MASVGYGHGRWTRKSGEIPERYPALYMREILLLGVCCWVKTGHWVTPIRLGRIFEGDYISEGMSQKAYKKVDIFA